MESESYNIDVKASILIWQRSYKPKPSTISMGLGRGIEGANYKFEKIKKSDSAKCYK
ncbi:MAG: hypothetical protein JJT76_03550 [Clostridiaceae bacterium]|nr:hypothetical protein [Clostridiaceae bacterium]